MALHVAYDAEADGFYPFQDHMEDFVTQINRSSVSETAIIAGRSSSQAALSHQHEDLLREKDQVIQSLQETIVQQQNELTHLRMKVAASRDNTKILEDMIDSKDAVITQLECKIEHMTRQMESVKSTTQDPLACIRFAPSTNFVAESSELQELAPADNSRAHLVRSPASSSAEGSSVALLLSPAMEPSRESASNSATSASVVQLVEGHEELDSKSTSQLSKNFLKSLGLTPLAQLPVDDTIAKRVKEKRTTRKKSVLNSSSTSTSSVSPTFAAMEEDTKALFESKFFRSIQPLYIIYKRDSNAVRVMNDVVTHIAKQLMSLNTEEAERLCKELVGQ